MNKLAKAQTSVPGVMSNPANDEVYAGSGDSTLIPGCAGHQKGPPGKALRTHRIRGR